MKRKNIRFLPLLLAAVLLFSTGGLPAFAQTVSDNRAGEGEEAADTSSSDFILGENDAVSGNEPEITISGQSLPGIQAGDITGPVNPIHDHSRHTTEFSYIYFGSYPQSEVTDKATIDAIDKAIIASGTAAEVGKDVWVNGIKYRRISKKDSGNSWFDWEPTNKGYRYFKWERLRWKVLKNDGKTLLVVADKAVDYKPFDEEGRYVTWETCTLRKWLNDSFYHTAFSNSEQNAVVAQKVVNDNNPDYGTPGGNNTNDKVWLLSIGEVTNEQYGFCSYNEASMSRIVQPSSYTYAKGSRKDGCAWLLRSPAQNGNDVMAVNGKLDIGAFNSSNYGICPALQINLSSALWSMTDDGTSGEAGEEKIPVSLQASKEKTVYYAGEALTIDDLKITAFYKQHPAKELKSGKYITNASEINMNTPGKKTLTVSYTSGGAACNASITITVKALKKLSVTGPSGKLAAGKKVRLTLKTTPKGASAASVQWTSSNKKYASVDKNGTVTVKKAGIGKSVTITASACGNSKVKSAYRFKIMKHAVKNIKLKAQKKTLKAGKSMTIKAAVKTTGKNANKSLIWKSSNKKYATVSSMGRVTAKKAGKGKSVTITAISTDGSNKKATVKITIK